MIIDNRELPRPHLAKLKALLNNRRLPDNDRPMVVKALERYEQWIEEIESIEAGQADTVQKLVDATNHYQMFIELELIFDSSHDFLYRQKGQLKIENTILEEFLPQLILRGLNLCDQSLIVGPEKSFAGLMFSSSLSNPGAGGHPILKTKDQDFILGKRIYLKTSFDKNFLNAENVDAFLGYVCAECKTNLDKTMFQEAVATSRDLKMAIPSSLYFLICEYLDMTPVSIISTYIDDVLIVRKAKRMSANVRQEFRTSKERRLHREDYVQFLKGSQFYADVFQRMIDRIRYVTADTDPTPDWVLKEGHF